MAGDRRDFIRKIGTLSAGASLIPLTSTPGSGFTEKKAFEVEADKDQKIKLNILQTTDVHCQIHAHDELFWENNKATFRKTGGYAHFATFMKNERKNNANTFLVDTGDMFQGSELSVKTTGKAISPILNALKYDLYLPGNWEVVYGKKEMQKLLGGLHGPKVCANMYHDLGNGEKGELVFPPYYIWNIQGIKIGFIGYTDHLVPIRQSPSYSKGILYSKPEENIAYYTDVLKKQEGCSFIIMAAHLGLSQQIHLANQEFCADIDYIFGGDTHERVRTPIQCKYTKVVEPGAFGSFCGKLELTIKNGKVVEEKYALIELASQAYKADKEMTELIGNIEKPFFQNINQIIGYSTIPLYRYFVIENTIDTMILNALRWKMTDIDIVLSNGFRFCPPRTTPDDTGNIPITNGFIYDMLPVDSIIRKGKVSGQQLINWMEKELNNVFAKDASKRFGGWVTKFNGMQIKFNAFGEEGQRIKSFLVAGKELDKDKIYSICACEREGDPDDMLCRMKNVKETTNTEFTLHSTMKEYLKANSPVTPTPLKSAISLDAPESLLTQVTGVDYQFS